MPWTALRFYSALNVSICGPGSAANAALSLALTLFGVACRDTPLAPAAPPHPPAAPAVTQANQAGPEPPETAKRAVVDEYHGIQVSDEYRWLESKDDPAVKRWIEAQNQYARSILDELPGRDVIQARVTAVYAADRPRYTWLETAQERWFVLVRRPPAEQPFVVVLEPGQDPARAKTLVDPNQLDASGKTAIDWFVPSPDGKLLAVSLSKAGTELGDLSIYDVASGTKLDETITRVNGGTAGGDLAWLPDSSGFYYTRYPRPKERAEEDLLFYQQVYFHELGTAEQRDRYEIGRDFPKIAENQLEVDARGRVLLTVQKGDGGQFAHFLRGGTGQWRQFSDYGDGIVQAAFIPGSTDLLVLSRKDSPAGELLRVDERTLAIGRARSIVPAGGAPLVSDFWGDRTLLVTEQAIFATYQLGGPSEVRVFDHAGKRQPFELPVDVASYKGLTRDGKHGVLFRAESFVDPVAWYRWDRKSSKLEKTALQAESPIDMGRFEVVREFAVSKDGTKVPVNILIPPETELDASTPAVVTGYGGYGVSLEPRFRPQVGLWLEQGVIYAVANLRGGGEYGEAWHRAGNLTNKQNVFDDFAAVLRHLIERRYTSSEQLGIIGGSNGGLLMGATLVQNPELVRAVVSYVGIYDMLRVELSPNGAFNVTEFGSVEDPAQFRALYAYSPYHNVDDGVAYPTTLLLTGANDPRVEPMQSRKMAARLQAASASAAPILLRTSEDTGHGGDTALKHQIAEQVDVEAFMLHALGVTPKKIGTP